RAWPGRASRAPAREARAGLRAGGCVAKHEQLFLAAPSRVRVALVAGLGLGVALRGGGRHRDGPVLAPQTPAGPPPGRQIVARQLHLGPLAPNPALALAVLLLGPAVVPGPG